MASLSDLQSYAAQVAQQFGIPTQLFDWQINQESGWNPSAQNGNATGIAQFMPSTAASMGVNASDPYSSLYGAAQYDAQLYSQTGNWQSALTKYGTLANVPSSVLSSFQSVMNSIGLGSGSSTSGTASGATQTAGAVAESDSFVMKIAMIILGIVLIGGAIMVYGRSAK